MSVDRSKLRTVAVVAVVTCMFLLLTTPFVGSGAASVGPGAPENHFHSDNPDIWKHGQPTVQAQGVGTEAVHSRNLTITQNGPNGTLRTPTITDAQTGVGNEVTIIAIYDEEMTQNATDVTVSPDVDGDLTTTPVVENKRWSDSRTFEAAVRFADDDESVSDVTLEIAGAREADGPVTENPVSLNYSVDTNNPRIVSAEVTGPFEVTVSFSEGVYSNEDGTGSLSTFEFDYDDGSTDGASAIRSVSHTSGAANATLTLDAEIQNSDLGADRITVPTRTIYDAAGNELANGTQRIADTISDDVKPTVERISATESGPSVIVSVTVDERLTAAEITIGNSSTLGLDDVTATRTTDDSYTYSVRHTPESDGTYRVAVHEVSDGSHTVVEFGTASPRLVTVDTTGPRIGSLTAPEQFINTTTPTIRVDGVSDRLHSVDETSVTVDVTESNGPAGGTVTDPSTSVLDYRNSTVTLDLSMTEWRLQNGTTYDVTVSADDTDQSANSNSKTFTAAFTVDTDAPTIERLSLSRDTIRDAQTGDTDEVTVTVKFGEPMLENADAVTVVPDVDGELSTPPTVENKRWSDSRTFKADIQYTDDDETVSGVRLEVSGATDLAGNSMKRAGSTTYDVETGTGIPDNMKILVALIAGLLVYYRLLRSTQQY